jgi:hypothetical protein
MSLMAGVVASDGMCMSGGKQTCQPTSKRQPMTRDQQRDHDQSVGTLISWISKVAVAVAVAEWAGGGADAAAEPPDGPQDGMMRRERQP